MNIFNKVYACVENPRKRNKMVCGFIDVQKIHQLTTTSNNLTMVNGYLTVKEIPADK